MPKKSYKCEVCGKRNYESQVVCCSCVERDLLSLNKRIDILEKKVHNIDKRGKQK